MASKSVKTTARIRHFLDSLSQAEQMLVILKRDLYEGNWDAMRQDLLARLDGKPYVFKLANRIEDDIERIEQLETFEQQNKIDLGDYIELPQADPRRR